MGRKVINTTNFVFDIIGILLTHSLLETIFATVSYSALAAEKMRPETLQIQKCVFLSVYNVFISTLSKPLHWKIGFCENWKRAYLSSLSYNFAYSHVVIVWETTVTLHEMHTNLIVCVYEQLHKRLTLSSEIKQILNKVKILLSNVKRNGVK